MKRLIASLMVTLALVGCADKVIIKKEIVTVDKPVPFIPVPPVVPKCNFRVDKLTAADQNTPGNVGQAYKYDMMCLRMRQQITDQILDQYTKSSSNFDDINKQITEMFDAINAKETAAVDKAAASPLTNR